MQTKIVTVLAALLCVCTFVNAFPVEEFSSVMCRTTELNGVSEEDCDNGTGVSREAGQPDNFFLGFDSKGRRVIKIGGDDGTCYIYPNNPDTVPANVEKMTMTMTKYVAVVTDADVLKSVEKWCGSNVLLLQNEAPLAGRHKRAVPKCRYFVVIITVTHRETGKKFRVFRLYRICRKVKE